MNTLSHDHSGKKKALGIVIGTAVGGVIYDTCRRINIQGFYDRFKPGIHNKKNRYFRMASPNAAYEDILSLFRRVKDKRQVTTKIDEFIDASPRSTDAEKANLARSLLDLKILLETKLMRDAECTYTFFGLTPESYGCDIRESFYDMEGNQLNASILGKMTSYARFIPEKIPHILTDIDDTLYPHPSSLHSIAGRDESWLVKKPYPGIRAFYQTFYENLPVANYKYSTVLSATPTAMKAGRIADPTYKSILGDNFGFLQGADRKRDALLAVFSGLFGSGSLEPNAVTVGNKKFMRFLEYRSIFPEYKLLFIGDNGQGDFFAGLQMLGADPDCMVFIHNIIVEDEFLFSSARVRAEEANFPGRLFFFKNYLELGAIFTRLNIFTEAQLTSLRESVTNDIRAKINEVCRDSHECTANKKIQHYTCGTDSALHAPATACIPSAVISSMTGGYKKTRRNRNKKRKVRKSRKH